MPRAPAERRPGQGRRRRVARDSGRSRLRAGGVGPGPARGPGKVLDVGPLLRRERRPSRRRGHGARRGSSFQAVEIALPAQHAGRRAVPAPIRAARSEPSTCPAFPPQPRRLLHRPVQSNRCRDHEHMAGGPDTVGSCLLPACLHGGWFRWSPSHTYGASRCAAGRWTAGFASTRRRSKPTPTSEAGSATASPMPHPYHPSSPPRS